MTRFQFRLQKVLEWREKQLELEEIRFKQRMVEIANLEQARQEVLSAGLEAERELRASAWVAGRDLAALAGFRRFVQARGRDLAARQGEARKQLAAQQDRMMEARRRCRLLERLKERRQSEWQAACDREVDQLASDSFLAMWGRGDR